jgi:hypothetical protein
VTTNSAVFRDVTPCGLVRTNVSDERVSSIFRMEKIRELGIALTVSRRLGHKLDEKGEHWNGVKTLIHWK